jgi:GR25 family glycosyltransferase involved in LPS biosynthesis
MIPIFCINLERATERREHIQKEWIDKLGLDITFWKAYDRRDIEQNKYVYIYKKQLAIKEFGRELNNGEIACATSFCMLYKHILENGYEEVVIMEDDISPLINDKQELLFILEQRNIEFPSSQVMFMGADRDKCKPCKLISIQNKHTSLCFDTWWGNQLFYIKKSAINRVYNILKTMAFPADYPQRILCKKNIVVASNKFLCVHDGRYSNTYVGNDIRGGPKTRDFFK